MINFELFNMIYIFRVLDENKPRKIESTAQGPSERITFTEYHTHDEINAYIDSLSGTETWINTVSIGSTYERNDMRVIEFTKAGSGKPNVFIEAGKNNEKKIGLLTILNAILFRYSC